MDRHDRIQASNASSYLAALLLGLACCLVLLIPEAAAGSVVKVDLVAKPGR